jgi:hypothetical protein
MLAYPLLPHIHSLTHAVEKLTQDKVKAVIFSLQGILLIFYLYALQITPNADPPKPQIIITLSDPFPKGFKSILIEFKHE